MNTLIVLEDLTIGQWVELGISGVVLVAIGVGLYLMFLMFKTQNKEIDKRNEDISKREANLVESSQNERKILQDLLLQVQNTMSQVVKHPMTEKEAKQAFEFQNFLAKELRFIHEQTHSARTFFCMYHNGTHSLNNINFYKFSLIDEAWNINLAPLHDVVQNYPSAVYKYWSDLLNKNKSGIIIKSIEELKNDTATYQFFSNREIKCFAAQGIFEDQTNKVLLGFIVNEYITYPEQWTEKDWNQMLKTVTRGADKIAGVIQASSADDTLRKEKEGGKSNGK